jgi:hypothetical protein
MRRAICSFNLSPPLSHVAKLFKNGQMQGPSFGRLRIN